MGAAISVCKPSDSSADETPVLYYWPARGRAEQIRLVLAEAGVHFVDENLGDYKTSTPVKRSEFREMCQKLSGSLTYQVPMLFVDGKYLLQSQAILRYLGRKYNLIPYGKEYEVDYLLGVAQDFRDENYKPCELKGGGSAEIREYVQNVIPDHLCNFQRLLGTEDYFLGEKLSLPDLSIYDVLTVCECQVPGVFAKYPSLSMFISRVEARQNISRWLKSDKRSILWAFPPLDLHKAGL
ncbi:hypothetical protein AAMO2058_001693800 [Amorphochlora amoebiformis]